MSRSQVFELSPEEKSEIVNGVSFFKMKDPLKENDETLQLLDGGTGINYEQLFGDLYESDGELMQRYKRSTLNNVIKYYYNEEKLNDTEKELHKKIKEKLFEKCGMKEYAPGCFPPGILLGSAWNPEAVYEVGLALGTEALIFGVDILLGTPNINIHRDPLAGRLFEGYSEDPYLISVLAPNLVRGVQDKGVAANVKHFACNNQETNRVGINEIISVRALEEIYLPGFRACMTKGNARTIMSAYNSINGVPCTQNSYLLTQKLRNEWNSDAAVISDWNAVSDQIASLKAGNDLKMPGLSDTSAVINAVKEGVLEESELDRSAERLLELSRWIKNKSKKNEVRAGDYEKTVLETDEAAYFAAAEGIVLLENDGTLPLEKKSWKFSLKGSGAQHFLLCGGGSAGVITNRNTDFSECLLKNFSGSVLTNDMSEADVIFIICSVEGNEGNDRRDFFLKKEDRTLLKKLGLIRGSAGELQVSHDAKFVLILNVSGPVMLSDIDMDAVNAVVCPFIPGMQGPAALADIISGKVCPSGKLPLSFPKRYEDAPSYINFPGDGHTVVYGEGIFTGYRYYEAKKIKPMYHFGYGLSYTDFDIGKIEELSADENISFDVKIKNTGKYAGSQVIQIYFSDPYSTLRKPCKELKSFRKVYLKPGEEKSVHFLISVDALRSFDPDLCEWTLEEGYYDIIVSDSSDPEKYADRVRFYLDVTSPYSFGINSTVKTVYENSSLKNIFLDFLEDMGCDTSAFESCYQYTPSRRLSELINEINKQDADISHAVGVLEENMRSVKKS